MKDPAYRKRRNASRMLAYYAQPRNYDASKRQADYRIKKENPAFRKNINLVERAAYRIKRKDPNFRMKHVLRSRLQMALRGKIKSASTMKLLGCAIEFFRQHIESQFEAGMSWSNHGAVWELDHILPCAAFHLQHSEEQEVCFHWTNFQPLFVADNRTKRDKINI